MNKRLLPGLVLFFAGLFHLTAGAQSQFSGWLASFNTIKTGKKTSIHADVQLRSTDQIKNMQTLLIRSGLNYHLNKQWTVTAGYAFTYNRRVVNDVSGYAPEHRIWEQFMYSHKTKMVSVTHRLRVEQRFIGQTTLQNNELESDGYGYANRIRYFIRNMIPLRTHKTFAKGLFAAVQEEVFMNFGNDQYTNGEFQEEVFMNFGNDQYTNGEFFDQNRVYLAIGYRVNASFDIEAGYMNQYTNGRNDAFTNNHIVQIAGYIRL